ncbi:hypothetical protein KAI10_00920, partial [Candidatus Bathyarchaeota archaeon]|nr:hypothetical protein [Candidatus Bathyarchaeota archaeon]
YIYDWPELGTAEIDEETMRRLHSDVRGVLDLEPESVRKRNRERAPHSDCIDSWGSGQKEISHGDWFPGVHPLTEAQLTEELDQYQNWPDMSDPTRIAHVRETAQSLAVENQYAIMATPWLLFPFERAFAMQGMDTFLLNLAMHPEFALALLRKHLELSKTLMGHVLRELGENVDIIKIGDDLGTQDSLMISPGMYREMLGPMHAEFIRFIKERTSAKVLFHTDGDVFDLIPDFIEMGVDILNPIQPSAKGKEPAGMKRDFGDALCFHGALDIQTVLSRGTPDQVRAEVERLCDILGPGGGFILAPTNNIMPETPVENILALYGTSRETGVDYDIIQR